MCLAIPGEVVSVDADVPEMATVDVQGVRRSVNVGLLDGIGPGDWVLIHVGFAMSQIDEEEAQQTLSLLQEMGDAYDDELRAMFEAENG